MGGIGGGLESGSLRKDKDRIGEQKERRATAPPKRAHRQNGRAFPLPDRAFRRRSDPPRRQNARFRGLFNPESAWIFFLALVMGM